MNKTVRILLLALVLTLMLLGLVACGHEHSFDEAWSHDGSHHWHAPSCEHEDAEDIPEVKDFGTHTMSETPVVVEPTCGKAGSRTYECTVCGYKRVEPISPTGEHTYGDTVIYTAPDANNLIYSQKQCTVCQKKGGYIHIFNGSWSSDAENHWHAPTCSCTGDGAPGNIDTAEHDFADEVTVAPTCTKAGATTKTCKTCGYIETLATTEKLGHNYTSVTYSASFSTVTAKKTCGRCRTSVSEPVEGAVVVKTTEEAQAALDAAGDGTLIYFAKADYGKLYLRTADGKRETYEGAGDSGTVNYREFKDIILVAHKDATFAGFGIGATGEAISLKNLTLLGLAFTGTETPFRLEGLYRVDGLTLDGCTLTPAEELGSATPYLLETAAGAADFTSANGNWSFTVLRRNITVKNCTVDGAFGFVKLLGTENLTLEGNTMKKLSGGAISLGGNAAYTGTVTVKSNSAVGIGDRFLYATGLEGVELTLSKNSVASYNAEAPTDVVKVEGTLSSLTQEGNSFPNGKTVVLPEVEE